MSSYESEVELRKAVVLSLIEKEPAIHADSIIEEAGKLCAFIFDEYPEEPSLQALNTDTQQKLSTAAVMEAFIEALPSHSGSLAFYLKKYGVLP